MLPKVSPRDKQQVILAIRTDRTVPDNAHTHTPDVVLFMTPVGSAFSNEGDGHRNQAATVAATAAAASSSSSSSPPMLVRPAASRHGHGHRHGRRRRRDRAVTTATPPVPAEAQQPKTTAAAVRLRRPAHNPARPPPCARPSAVPERLTAAQRARRWFAIAVRLARVLGHLEHGAMERAGAAMLATVAYVEQSMWGLGLLPAARYHAALRRHGHIGVPWHVVGWPAKRAFWLRIHALARAVFDEHTQRVHLYNAAFAAYCAGGGEHQVADNNAPPPTPDVLSTQTLVRLHKAVNVLHTRLYGGNQQASSRPRRNRRTVFPDLPPRALFRSLAETVLFQIDNTTQQPRSATANLWL